MTTGRTHRSIFISAECSSFFNSGFSHVVKETHGVGANSDGRQEVEMVNESMEETVEESLYRSDLEPISSHVENPLANIPLMKGQTRALTLAES